MSYLSRTLRKQYRILRSLAATPLISLSGFGLKEIIVFPERSISIEEALFCSKVCTKDIDSGLYGNIQEFDAYHTADIEFSHFYHGKFNEKYNNRTKQQLITLGEKWRLRVEEDYPDAQIWIVVHYDVEHGWFLDTFNYDIAKKWDTKAKYSIWL
jgi:hypothetical protein